MGEEEDLLEYLQQLAEVKTKLLQKPGDAELLSLKQELEEIIELTRGLIEEQNSEKKPVHPPPPPSSAHPVGISQAAKRYVMSEVTELSGWRVGDRCLTVFLDDGKKYPAIVSALKPDTKSAVVTFVKYLNQQDTPLVFLERVAAEEQPANAGKDEKKDGKRAIVIKATDAPEVVERKKRLLKKQKREEKVAEKDKLQTQKVNSWQSFQSASSSRPPLSAGAALAAASKNKPPSSSSDKAKGVRTRWDKGTEQQEQE